MRSKLWFVSTLAGAVLAIGLCSTPMLQAADKKADSTPGGKVYGIVTAKTDKDITIKAEGETDAKRYLLAPKGGAVKPDVQAALKMVFPTNLVVFQSQGDDYPALTGIQALHSKTRQGTTSGTIVAADAKAQMPYFDLKPFVKGQHTERYVARWDRAAKSVDKKLTQIIAGLNVGDKVKVAWYYDERKRAMQIQVTAKAKPESSGK